jgi:hypothetical protein
VSSLLIKSVSILTMTVHKLSTYIIQYTHIPLVLLKTSLLSVYNRGICTLPWEYVHFVKQRSLMHSIILLMQAFLSTSASFVRFGFCRYPMATFPVLIMRLLNSAPPLKLSFFNKKKE